MEAYGAALCCLSLMLLPYQTHGSTIEGNLDTSKVDMASPENPKLYELWQYTFAMDPLKAMDLKIERLRAPIEKLKDVEWRQIRFHCKRFWITLLFGQRFSYWKISIQNKSTLMLPT